MSDIAILGGGMMGCCAALELAQRGTHVVLIDQAASLLSAAAAANEGKLHFGYVYSRDTSMASAWLMQRGALAMAPALRRWLGDAAVERLARSGGYRYAVHRDSLSSPDEVAAAFARFTSLAGELLSGARPDCFGADPRRPPVRVALADDCDPAQIQGLFTTDEISLDNREVSDMLRAAVAAEPRIEVLLGHRALSASLAPDGVTVQLAGPGGSHTRRFGHVVNATWTSRLALDATVGLAPPPEWLFRLKYLVRIRPSRPVAMPPTTICVGGFGDVVPLPDGKLVLSWYPLGRQGVSAALAPPDWGTSMAGEAADAMRAGMVAGLGALFPPLLALLDDPALTSAEVSGGVIFAHGASDVNDPGSGLHNRHRIGRRSLGRSHSVDPGKWTTCPLFALEVAEHIAPAARRAA